MRRFAACAGLVLVSFLPALPAAADSPFDRIVPLVQSGDPMPRTAFTDQNGHRVTFDDLKGNAVAVAFVYTRCRDACPVITQKMGRVRDALGEGPFKLVEITIDPQHDDRAAISAYARQYGIEAPGWLMLTGAPLAVADFNRRMGIQTIESGPNEILHNDRIAIVASDGSVADLIDGSSWTPADLAAQIRYVAGKHASMLDRFDLALGKAAAYCGSVISGRSGIADVLASVAVFAAGIGLFVWFARRTFGAQG
jgi:cytochrome oxidase Cu insertion factor (SCO1/SenC/PrrC family)